MKDYASIKIGERCETPGWDALVNGSVEVRFRSPTKQELARYPFEKKAQYIHVASGAVFEGEAYWVRVE